MMRKRNNNRGPRQGGHGGGGHGGGGRRYHGGGGGGHGGGRNDGQNLARSKHHAIQMREKYNSMARDAQMGGDRSDVEYYLQHVDHYTRVLADIAVIEAERFASQRDQQQSQGGGDQQQQNNDSSGGDANSGGGDNGGGGQEPIQPGHQPRMTRSHNRPQHNAPQGDESSSQQGGNNNNDIPLPSGILPAI